MLDYSTFSYFLLHNGFKLQEIKGSERGGGGGAQPMHKKRRGRQGIRAREEVKENAEVQDNRKACQ